MTQITARRERTRDRLLDAARGVFAERGVQAASVEEICERAGFTRGAFYSNFESKNDLVLAFLHRSGEEVLGGARHTLDLVIPRLAESEDPGALLAEAVAVFINTQNHDVEGILASHEMRLHAARVPEVREAFLELEASSRARFVDMMSAGLTALDWEWAMDPDVALAQLNGVYEHNALQAVITGRDTEEVLTPLLGLMLSAMVRPKGA